MESAKILQDIVINKLNMTAQEWNEIYLKDKDQIKSVGEMITESFLSFELYNFLIYLNTIFAMGFLAATTQPREKNDTNMREIGRCLDYLVDCYEPNKFIAQLIENIPELKQYISEKNLEVLEL